MHTLKIKRNPEHLFKYQEILEQPGIYKPNGKYNKHKVWTSEPNSKIRIMILNKDIPPIFVTEDSLVLAQKWNEHSFVLTNDEFTFTSKTS